jgi:hypothetical protein
MRGGREGEREYFTLLFLRCATAELVKDVEVTFSWSLENDSRLEES